jgi:hypothetical protein
MGLLKDTYSEFADLVTFDENGALHIDYVAADRLDATSGPAFEAYVNRMVTLRDAIDDATDAVETTNDELKVIRTRGRDQYIDLENRVLSALVS